MNTLRASSQLKCVRGTEQANHWSIVTRVDGCETFINRQTSERVRVKKKRKKGRRREREKLTKLQCTRLVNLAGELSLKLQGQG